tara:strand:+ start:631 stop:960 length:330 start_codon:yes stop_codon:yes gene_type:complete
MVRHLFLRAAQYESVFNTAPIEFDGPFAKIKAQEESMQERFLRGLTVTTGGLTRQSGPNEIEFTLHIPRLLSRPQMDAQNMGHYLNNRRKQEQHTCPNPPAEDYQAIHA